MDIKRKESKLVISNQSSVIKTPKKKRLVLGFRKWFSTPSPVLGESLPAGRQGLGRGKEKPSLSPSTSTSPPEGEIGGNKKRKLIFSLALILLIIAPISFYLWNKQAGASWWNSDWNYRRSITINSSQIPGDLNNFPMLVSFTDSNLINKTQSNGNDIIFIEENGNRLDHEIEKFDSATGELVAWVRIPQLEGDYDTTLYMYYGNQTIDNQQRPEEVWDENFKTVQHLEEGGTGTRYDSTRSNTDATTQNFSGDESISSAKINGGADLEDDDNTYFDLGTPEALNISQQITLSAWVRVESDNNSRIISKSGASSNLGYILARRAAIDSFDFSISTNGTNWDTSSSDSVFNTGTWYYVVGTYDGTTKRMFINGSEESNATLPKVLGANMNVSTVSTQIGRDEGYGNDGYIFDGIIDEVRISNTARSANWITTEYNNQNSPATFISLGSEERGPAPVLYLPFDEGFGTTAYDETSNRNDGTIVGATWKDESMCKSGKCLEFDGTGDYVEIADNQSLDLSEEVTLEAWVKPTSTTPQNQTIISKEEKSADPTKIYRSVGPSATTAIAVGTSNAMNITGDRATFATSLPNNVGVGDAIQYDSDNDNDIDASDSIVFIKERVTSYEFLVATANGGAPIPVNSDTNWSLFRAYTSLANAEKGVENTGIDSDLRNFDDWTAGGDATTDDVGKDLVAANQQWNIACYANGTTADNAIVNVGNWITGVNNFLNIYTPININEVGVSQRHGGKWDENKYKMSASSSFGHVLGLGVDYVRVSGLQLGNFSDSSRGINLSSSGNFYIDSCIIKDTWEDGIRIDLNLKNLKIYIWNNILYDNVTGIYFRNSASSLKGYIYNNSIFGCGTGIDSNSFTNSGLYFKNNISVGNTTNYNFLTSFPFLENNLTDQAPDSSIAIGATYATGTTDGTTANKLINSAETFITKGVQVGSIIANTTDSTYTYVTALDSETQLSVANDIFVSGEAYSIYKNKYGNVSFVSTTAGSEDFHLSPTDTVAKNSGADLSGDSVFPFNSDIDGQQRLDPQEGGTTAWDIGADEARATQIYRSVAPGKTDALETGDGNAMTINGSIATFQRALADNVGVGDAIQYDANNDGTVDAIAFISERFQNSKFKIQNSAGGVPTAVAGDNDWSLFRAYTSLANAENGTENTGIDSDLRNFDTWTGGKDLITSKEQWNIACYANGTTADTTAVTVDGWTTGVQNFVKIYTPVSESEVGVSQRHNGKWDEGRYKLIAFEPLKVFENYSRIIGLQVGDDTTSTYSSGAIRSIYENNKYQLYDSLIIRKYTGSNLAYSAFWIADIPTGTVLRNSVIYDFNGGTYGAIVADSDDGTNFLTIQNVTIYNSEMGIHIYEGSYTKLKNVLSYDNSIADFNINGNTWHPDSNYNLSSDGTAPGANSKINQTVAFVDATNRDLHLAPTDTAARNAGKNLSNDPYFPIKTDIDGDKRLDLQGGGTTSWDIGADEAVATKIYRSVGPNNTTALATDEGHKNVLNVLNGEVSFSESLPDRIGVGDAVIIDTAGTANAIDASDTLLFIHGRIDSKNYLVRTHTGAVPSNISSNDTYQIFRAYTSLANAENGTKNTSIPITFNGGNRDLVANNEEWNIACYGDGLDTTAVTVDGWTTGIENYLKIYTPVNSNEVGISQRHNGKWDEEKYKIMKNDFTGNGSVIYVIDLFVSIDGIQIGVGMNIGAYAYAVNIGSMDNANIYLANNIVKQMPSSAGHVGGLIMQSDNGSIINISNNVLYGLTQGTAYPIVTGSSLGSTSYVYNNTISGSAYGIVGGASQGALVAKNNIVQDCTVDGYYGTYEASSDFNISYRAADAPGANSKNSTTVTFRDAANNDYRLAMNDTAAKGAGINLSGSQGFDPLGISGSNPLMYDIEGEKRPSLRQGSGLAMPSSLATSYNLQPTSYSWDIGADQISNTIHNNYSLNLKTNYPQTNFSTGENDRENFSSGDINLEPNEWSHLVYKRSNDIEEMYINGSKKDSKSISNFLKTNNGKLYLGAQDGNSKNSFKGFLDEIRIYPYARTEAEVKKDTTQGSSGRAASRASEGVGVAIGETGNSLSDGLVGHWKMDETTGTTVADSSGNNNHGTLTNAQETGTSDASGNTLTTMVDTDGTLATTDDAYNGMILRFTAVCGSITSGTERAITDYTGATKTFTVATLASIPDSCAYEIDHQVGGKFGSGVNFDGGDDYVTVSNSDSTSLTNAYTYSAWVRFDDILTGLDTLISKQNTVSYDAGGREWSIGRSSAGGSLGNGNVKMEITQNQANYFTGYNYPYQQWFYFSVSWDGNVVKIYSNGKLTDILDVEGELDTRTFPLLLGKGTDAFGWDGIYSGFQDDIRLYNRALSPDEIQQLYNYAPGPVLHLKMDEKSGTTAFDSSGNNNHGTLVNGPIWENGKINGGLGFYNTDSAVNVSNVTLSNLSQVTISAWARKETFIDNTSGVWGFTSNAEDWSNLQALRLVDENLISVYTGTSEADDVYNSFNISGSGVMFGEWIYLTTVTDYLTGKVLLYINGVKKGESINTYNSTSIENKTHSNALVGKFRGVSGWDLDGDIDDFKIYNYARTQEQILEDMSSRALSASGGGALQKPILDLSFDEGQGPTAFDSSGNNNHGTLVSGTTGGNTTTTAMWDKGGKKGGAMEFDGVDDYIYIDKNIFNGLSGYTVSMWINRNPGVVNYLFSGSSGFPHMWDFGALSGIRFKSSGADPNYITTPLADSTWYNIVVSQNGNSATWYVNGKKNKEPEASSLATYNTGVYFGSNFDASSFWGGKIDEVKIYNYALSEDEIKTLYNDSSAMVMGNDESRDNNGTEVTGANKDYCIPGDTAKCDKPVLELKMDEMSGTTANDTSGNGNNGTLTNGPIWEPNGKIGSALKFDGVDDYISLATPFYGDQTNSFEFWAKPTLGGSGLTVFGLTNAANNQIGVSGTVMRYRAGDGSWIDISTSSTGSNYDLWNHFAYVRSGTIVDFYKNGVKVGSGDIATNSDIGINRIGARSISEFFKGQIDEVRIYDYARTPAQIAWDYNQGKPINHWTFDEGTGSTVHDEGPNLNNGTITGATWKNESECKNGKCLYFNGLDTTRVDADTQDNMSQFTACAWVNPKAWTNTSGDSEMFIFNKGWSFSLLDNGKLRLFLPTSGSYPDIQTASTLGLNEWHRVCVAFGGVGQTSKIFIDGIEQDLSSSWGGNGTQSDDSSAILRIGAAGNEYYGNFYGYIDDPKIYNYALTDEQIKMDYNEGAVNFR